MSLFAVKTTNYLHSSVDKLVLSLKLERNPTEDELLRVLSEMEHLFRIFENVSLIHVVFESSITQFL